MRRPSNTARLAGIRGRTVILKVKFAYFKIITRSWSASSAVANREVLAHL